LALRERNRALAAQRVTTRAGAGRFATVGRAVVIVVAVRIDAVRNLGGVGALDVRAGRILRGALDPDIVAHTEAARLFGDDAVVVVPAEARLPEHAERVHARAIPVDRLVVGEAGLTRLRYALERHAHCNFGVLALAPGVRRTDHERAAPQARGALLAVDLD